MRSKSIGHADVYRGNSSPTDLEQTYEVVDSDLVATIIIRPNTANSQRDCLPGTEVVIDAQSLHINLSILCKYFQFVKFVNAHTTHTLCVFACVNVDIVSLVVVVDRLTYVNTLCGEVSREFCDGVVVFQIVGMVMISICERLL